MTTLTPRATLETGYLTGNRVPHLSSRLRQLGDTFSSHSYLKRKPQITSAQEETMNISLPNADQLAEPIQQNKIEESRFSTEDTVISAVYREFRPMDAKTFSDLMFGNIPVTQEMLDNQTDKIAKIEQARKQIYESVNGGYPTKEQTDRFVALTRILESIASEMKYMKKYSVQNETTVGEKNTDEVYNSAFNKYSQGAKIKSGLTRFVLASDKFKGAELEH